VNALAPSQLWWLLLLAVPVVLHLVRPRPRALRTTTLPFFLGLDRRSADSPWLRWLKRLIALLLSVAVMGAATAAAARVVVGGGDGGVRGVVVLVDRSASLAARGDDGRTRFAALAERLQARVSALPPTVPVTVLAYDARPTLVLARSVDRQAAARAIAALAPRPVAGDPEPAIALARRLAAVDAPAALWHATDHAGDDGGDERVAIERVLPPAMRARNVGIVAADLRRLPLERNRYAAFVQIDAVGQPAETIECELDVAFDGRVVEVRRLSIASGASERLQVPVAAGDARRLGFTLRAADDRLVADDRVELTVPEPRTLRVVVASRAADPFIALALLACAGDGLAVETVAADAWPTPAPACELLVCDGWLPAELPAGVPTVLIDPPSAPPGVALRRLDGDGAPIESPRVIDATHPLLYGIATRRVRLTQTAAIEAESGVEPLWASPAGAALAAATVAGRRLVVMAFAPARSEDLPLSAAFPLLMANAVGWATQGDDEATPAVWRTGALIDADGAVAWDDAAVATDGETRPRELDRVGVWRAGAAAGTAALLARAETGLGDGADPALTAVDGGFGGELARAALWAALALLIAESWLFHRRGVA